MLLLFICGYEAVRMVANAGTDLCEDKSYHSREEGHIKLGWDKDWDLQVRLELCHKGFCRSWREKLAGTPKKTLGTPSPIQ